ncbi:hypothetical protein E2C01_018984 [Portunus trituberculatus]|uniref:Uncharacterized protein n=1 Tax=Portunus trituberculatus TaxID=210409 RepID=A0A5B7DW38_PORTR|nr:hypothetical protein [Portunus trituberculatus]
MRDNCFVRGGRASGGGDGGGGGSMIAEPPEGCRASPHPTTLASPLPQLRPACPSQAHHTPPSTPSRPPPHVLRNEESTSLPETKMGGEGSMAVLSECLCPRPAHGLRTVAGVRKGSSSVHADRDYKWRRIEKPEDIRIFRESGSDLLNTSTLGSGRRRFARLIFTLTAPPTPPPPC